MSHAFVRVAGLGLRIVPKAPFVMALVGDAADTIELTGLVNDEEQHVRVRAGDTLAPEFGALSVGPSHPGLRLEVGGVYELPWPTGGLALISAPDPGEPPFYMFSDLDGGLVYVQGPMPNEHVPSLDAMLGTGQRELQRGETAGHAWVEMAYEHDGDEWRQLHVLAAFSTSHKVVVTTQAFADRATTIHAAAHEIASSITACKRPAD